MDQNNFDKYIREKLTSIEEDTPSSSWDILSKKLDQEADKLHDEDFDNIIRGRLSSFEPSHASGDWDALDQMLTEKESQRKKMIFLKLVEAAIVLILISTIYHYNELKRGFGDKVDVAFMLEASVQSISAQREIDLLLQDDRIVSVQEVIDVQTSSYSLSEATLLTPVLDKLKFDLPLSSHSFGNRKLPTIAQGVIARKEMPTVESLPIKPLNTNKATKPEVITDDVVQILGKKSSRNQWISIPISHDINTISSSLSPNFGGIVENHSTVGQSTGILFSQRIKQLEIVSGIIYGEKDFEPIDVNNVDLAGKNSYIRSSLNNINIRQISVPLHFKGIINTNSSWEPYAIAGVGFNTILSIDYDISREVLSNTRSATSLAKTNLNFKTLPRGFMQEGGWFHNTYINYAFGIGLQASIKDDLQWYVQPTYQSSTSSNVNEIVGHLQSMRLEAGLRFRL